MIDATANPVGYFASNANAPRTERERVANSPPVLESGPKEGRGGQSTGNHDSVELSRAALEGRIPILPEEESPEEIEAGVMAKEKSEQIQNLTQQIRQELRQQQAELLRRLLEGADSKFWSSTSIDGHGNTHVVQLMVFLAENGEIGVDPSASVNGQEEEEGESNPNDYWNAENTSERIVNFAMSFAKAQEEAPREFGESMKAAVEEGFRQAQALTGNLPGAAGELNRETHRLTFQKLEERLEAWKSALYNEPAPNQQVSAINALP